MEKVLSNIHSKFEALHTDMVVQLRKYMSGRKFFEGSEDFPRFQEWLYGAEPFSTHAYLPTDDPYLSAILYLDKCRMRYGRPENPVKEICLENIPLDLLYYIIRTFADYEKWLSSMPSD